VRTDQVRGGDRRMFGGHTKKFEKNRRNLRFKKLKNARARVKSRSHIKHECFWFKPAAGSGKLQGVRATRRKAGEFGNNQKVTQVKKGGSG